MSHRRVLLCVFVLAALTGAAPDADEKGGRFVMTPVEGGYLRMDSHTGAVSMCQRISGKWACEAVVDDRRGLETELERLAAENRELSLTIKRLEEMLLPADGKGRADKGPAFRIPSEEEVDRAMGYVQRLLRKFKEQMRELEKDDGRKL